MSRNQQDRNSSKYPVKELCSCCSQPGHISSQCFKLLKKCIFCCSPSHSFSSCPESLCPLCNISGHSLKNCNYAKRCAFCNIAGHSDNQCISESKINSQNSYSNLTCLNCRKKGHANCSSFKDKRDLFRTTCSFCGQAGHILETCPNKNKSLKKRDLYKTHVKQAMKNLPEFDRELNVKERKYWVKVTNKAFKKLLKRKKLRKNRKKIVYE